MRYYKINAHICVYTLTPREEMLKTIIFVPSAYATNLMINRVIAVLSNRVKNREGASYLIGVIDFQSGPILLNWLLI